MPSGTSRGGPSGGAPRSRRPSAGPAPPRRLRPGASIRAARTAADRLVAGRHRGEHEPAVALLERAEIGDERAHRAPGRRDVAALARRALRR